MEWFDVRRLQRASATVLLLVAVIGGRVAPADAVTLGAATRLPFTEWTYQSVSDDLKYVITGSDSPQPLTRTSLSTGVATTFSLPGFFAGSKIATSDGQNILYSTLDALVPADTDATSDTYLYRIVDGSVSLVSGTLPAPSSAMAASRDGQVVVVGRSHPIGAGGPWRIDQANNTVIDLLALVPGERPFSYRGHSAVLSANGRYTAFLVGGTGAIGFECSACTHAYVHDAQTGTVTLVDRGAGGAPANGNVLSLELSADGRHVLFGSSATDLVVGQSQLPSQGLWVHDLDTGVVQRVAPLGISRGRISGNGRRVVYDTEASTFMRGQAYVFDRSALDSDSAKTPLATVPNGYFTAGSPWLSADGAGVVFLAGNDVSGDGLGGGMFRRSLPPAPAIPVLSTPPPPVRPSAPATAPLVRIDSPGRSVVDVSANGRFVLTTGPATGIVRRIDRTTGQSLSVDLPFVGGSTDFALTPDGSQMLFTSGYELTPDDIETPIGPFDQNFRDVYAYRFGSGEIRLLTGGGTPALGGFRDGMQSSLNGRYLVVTSSYLGRYYAYWVDTVDPRVVSLGETVGLQGSVAASISGDGRYAAFAGSSHVYLYDATTGRSSIVDAPAPTDGAVQSVTISADGNWLVVGRYAPAPTWAAEPVLDQLYVVAVAGGPRRLLDKDGYAASISTDGGIVSYTRGPYPRRDVVIADMSSAVPALFVGVAATEDSGYRTRQVLATDGSVAVFSSRSTTLSPGDPLADDETYAIELGAHIDLPSVVIPPPIDPPPVDPPPVDPPPSPVNPPAEQAGYVPITPRRLLDTRPGGTTDDARFAGIGLQQPGTRLLLGVTGRAGVPAGAMAAVINVTVTGSPGDGFLTAWPCDTLTPPNASSLNFTAGQSIANLVVAPLSPDGTVCLQTAGSPAHLLADISGYFPVTSTYAPVTPKRLLDTRPGATTTDAILAGIGLQPPGTRLTINVAGRAGVPAGAAAAVLNITVTGATGNGYLTVWPCDTPEPPTASNLNYVTGQTIPNLVIAPLSPDGTTCVQTSGAAAHVLADANGYFGTGATYVTTAPTRLLDTRPGGGTTDSQFAGLGLQSPGGRLILQVTGRGHVPGGATAAVLNITVTEPAGSGYLTAWPCDSAEPPTASNLNFVAGQTIPNLVIAPLSPSGTVCLQTSEAAAHILADINGYYPSG